MASNTTQISPVIFTSIDRLIYLFLELVQHAIIYLFAAKPPAADLEKRNGLRIAVVGAGLTGVSAAAHCVGHSADVTIFEAGPRERLGGIWARVNDVSSLQINSALYRFHPSVRWDSKYPGRRRIVGEIEQLWRRYRLDEKTRFSTPVTSANRAVDGKWVINDRKDLGTFDGVVASVGTCGEPEIPKFLGEEDFKGVVRHSSELEGVDVRGKRIIIVGCGASAVEAVEYCADGDAVEIDILARSEKWIIPRNIVINALLVMNVFGYQTSLSFIPEFLLRRFFYRDLANLAPTDKGLFFSTPMCNNEILELVRSGKVRWRRGEIERFAETGLHFNNRCSCGNTASSCSCAKRNSTFHKADVFVYATGFKRPTLHFLPSAAFAPPYSPPSWYLQTFPPGYPDVCAINSGYLEALGTAGHVHIGVYTRLLLMFLSDASTRPSAREMQRWIDAMRWLKRYAPTDPFAFFTYSEMGVWLLSCLVLSPARWSWAVFVLLGWGGGRAGGVGVKGRRTGKEALLGAAPAA